MQEVRGASFEFVALQPHVFQRAQAAQLRRQLPAELILI